MQHDVQDLFTLAAEKKTRGKFRMADE